MLYECVCVCVYAWVVTNRKCRPTSQITNKQFYIHPFGQQEKKKEIYIPCFCSRLLPKRIHVRARRKSAPYHYFSSFFNLTFLRKKNYFCKWLRSTPNIASVAVIVSYLAYLAYLPYSHVSQMKRIRNTITRIYRRINLAIYSERSICMRKKIKSVFFLFFFLELQIHLLKWKWKFRMNFLWKGFLSQHLPWRWTIEKNDSLRLCTTLAEI